MDNNSFKSNVKKLFKKENFCTIPNYLTIFRILLIPFIVYFYMGTDKKILSVTLLLLSGLSDIFDGIIARKFNKTSDFGRVFDPIADKLTQGAVLICLTTHFERLTILVILFIIKEIVQGIFAGKMLSKTGEVTSANWYGKLSTTLIYSSALLFILFPDMSNALADALIIICTLMLVLSLILYIRFFNHKTK